MGEGVSRSVPGFSLNSARNVSFHSWNTKIEMHPIRKASKREKKEKKKKNLGREKRQVRVNFSKGPEGGRESAPSPDKKARGVPVTLCQTQRSEKIPRNIKTGANRSRTTAPPGPHSGAGRVRRPGGMPRTKTGPPLLDRVKKPQNTTEGENKNNRKKQPKPPLPPSRPEKGPQKGRASSSPVGSRRIPKNARGPEWHPEKTPRSGTHGQKGRTNKCERDKKGTGKATQVRVGVCPVTT